MATIYPGELETEALTAAVAINEEEKRQKAERNKKLAWAIAAVLAAAVAWNLYNKDRKKKKKDRKKRHGGGGGDGDASTTDDGGGSSSEEGDRSDEDEDEEEEEGEDDEAKEYDVNQKPSRYAFVSKYNGRPKGKATSVLSASSSANLAKAFPAAAAVFSPSRDVGLVLDGGTGLLYGVSRIYDEDGEAKDTEDRSGAFEQTVQLPSAAEAAKLQKHAGLRPGRGGRGRRRHRTVNVWCCLRFDRASNKSATVTLSVGPTVRDSVKFYTSESATGQGPSADDLERNKLLPPSLSVSEAGDVLLTWRSSKDASDVTMRLFGLLARTPEPEGTYVRGAAGKEDRIYLIQNGRKRWVDWPYYSAHEGPVVDLAPAAMAAIPNGPRLLGA